MLWRKWAGNLKIQFPFSRLCYQLTISPYANYFIFPCLIFSSTKTWLHSTDGNYHIQALTTFTCLILSSFRIFTLNAKSTEKHWGRPGNALPSRKTRSKCSWSETARLALAPATLLFRRLLQHDWRDINSVKEKCGLHREGEHLNCPSPYWFPLVWYLVKLAEVPGNGSSRLIYTTPQTIKSYTLKSTYFFFFLLLLYSNTPTVWGACPHLDCLFSLP